MTDKKSENQTEKTETKENKGMTRREMLKLSAVAGTGIAVGATGLGTILNVVDHVDKALTPKEKAETGVPFYATNQAGIITAQQTYCYIASFDIQTESRQILQDLFVKWTKFADLTTSGGVLRDVDNDMLPPNDTGEADGLGISNFTVTLGYGPTFFEKDGKDRFGVKAKKPKYLEKIPHMAHDSLDEAYSDGDLCIQVCADDQQVAFHGIRNFIRLASGVAVVRWIEEGFLSAPKTKHRAICLVLKTERQTLTTIQTKVMKMSFGRKMTNQNGCETAATWAIAKSKCSSKFGTAHPYLTKKTHLVEKSIRRPVSQKT